ncbi:BTB/POZ and MATH domain-containing protein 1-like [Carex rostrata]
MAISASVNYIKVVHHFNFNCSEMKDMKPEQFVSSPLFFALGNEWVIDCYPRGTRQDMSGKTCFLVRLHGEYKTVNPTISLSLLNRDGTTYILHQYLKGDGDNSFRYWIQKSPFRKQVYAYSEIFNATLRENFVNDGSYELICSIDHTDIPHNRISLGVLKSFDLHSQIGKLLECNEKADVTFHVGNRSFMCHRLILAARSPVFNAELFGSMAEATEKHIKIEDMSPKVFEGLLQFIYTDSFPSCDSEKSSMKMAQHLFVAADRYAIEGLKKLCEDILCGSISLDTVSTTLALAQQFNSTRIKNACLDFIAEPGTLFNWMLSDKYDDLVTSFPSIMAEVRDRVNTGPSFRNVKKRKTK